jgi:hypothetical protein
MASRRHQNDMTAALVSWSVAVMVAAAAVFQRLYLSYKPFYIKKKHGAM